jgi:hypothetical protein
VHADTHTASKRWQLKPAGIFTPLRTATLDHATKPVIDRRLATRLAAAALSPLLIGACDPGLFAGPAATTNPKPEAGEDSPVRYARGSATIRLTVDGSVTMLDRLAGARLTAQYDPVGGIGQAEWSDSAASRSLTVLASGSPNDAWAGKRATLWIEDYAGPMALYADGSACAIQLAELSVSALSGRAECRGLRWLNAYDAETDPANAKPLPDRPAFDALIAFEALP